MADRLQVEVVFALPDKQELLALSVAAGSTIDDVISLSGLTDTFSAESLQNLQVGIWGQPAARDRGVQDGDRVELYRPLQRDPREARRELAQSGHTMNEPDSG